MKSLRLALLAIIGVTSGSCDDCTDEDRQKIAQGIVQLAMVLEMQKQCGMSTQIDRAPVVFYARSCFHDGGPPPSEMCRYALAVVREGNKICEALYIYDNGSVNIRIVPNALRVQGTIRTLVVGVDRNTTSLAADFGTEWVPGQNSINQAYTDYATSVGMPAAIAQYQNTNVVVRAQDLENGGTDIYLDEPQLKAKLDDIFSHPSWHGQPGLQTSNFDVLIVVALDPVNPIPGGSGGAFASGRRILLWWPWAAGPATPVEITAMNWANLAHTAYGHELAHLAGNPADHHWPPDTSEVESALWVAPQTLGWTDTNQNGSIDLVDPNPYDMP